MSLRGKFFAATYDRQIAKTEKAGLRALRQQLLAAAAGDVLEIGGGTGANLPFYGTAVQSLTITEPEAPMLRRLERKAQRSWHRKPWCCARLQKTSRSTTTAFDVAVSTLVLCGVSDQPRALRQLRRVLRPGGQLLFIEHVRSDDAKLARRQDRMNPINRFVVHCDCNRPTLTSIEQAGFTVTQLEHQTMPKVPSFVSPLIVGIATAPLEVDDRRRRRFPEPLKSFSPRQPAPPTPLVTRRVAGSNKGTPTCRKYPSRVQPP